MAWLYLALAVVSFASLAVFTRISVRSGGEPFGNSFWLFAGGIAVTGLSMVFGQAPAFTPAAVGNGLFSGFSNVGAGIVFAFALRIGHYGFSLSILSASFIISVLYSVLAWNEPFMLEGMAVILLSIYLIASSEQAEAEKGEWKKWLALILAAFALNGLPQIAQARVSMLSAPESAGFLFVNFVAGGLVLFFITSAKGKFRGPNLRYGLLASLGSFFGTLFTLKACGLMAKTVYFPVFFSAYNMTALLLSAFLFREKISLRGFVGIALGIAGVIVVSLKLSLLK